MQNQTQQKPPRETLLTTLQYAIKFGMVGVLNTAIDFGVFTLLTQVFGWGVEVSQVISYTCGLVNSYFFNSRWVFKKENKKSTVQVAKFVAVNLVALGVSVGVLSLLVNSLHMNQMWAKVIATCFSLVVNFIGNKLFVFGDKKNAA